MGLRGMTHELNNARAYLRTAQDILAHWRSQPHTPRWLITQAEHRVLGSLEWVWQAQCRAVFEDHDDGFFETDKCRRFVNNVDWGASYDTGATVPSRVVQLKSPMPELIP